jgi:hypothetical protein
MAGTALNFNPNKITNNYGWFWVNMAVPGAGARATLFTDLTPDATANPSAKHLGHTNGGWELKATPTVQGYTADEAMADIKRTPTHVVASLAANLLQTADISGVMQYLAQGLGTYSTAAGYEQITLGIITMAYLCVALIWPTELDPTKAGVYMLYKAVNDQGLANQVKRTALGNNPVVFSGMAVTSRAVTDQVGNYWQQI